MRRWYRIMIEFLWEILRPCLFLSQLLFFIFSFYLLFSISVSCFLFFHFLFLCYLSLIYYKSPMQFFLGSFCQHLIFSAKNGISARKKSVWRGKAAILWALCTRGCFFHWVVSRTPRGQWQERDTVQTPWSSNIYHFRARLSHTWMLNEFTIRNYIRKKFFMYYFPKQKLSGSFNSNKK